MGVLNRLRRSVRKSRLIKKATARIRSIDLHGAVDEIYRYLCSDDIFKEVIRHFNATRDDIEAIMLGLMLSGAGATHRGHFVPVSAVLFPSTLAYLLRSERGQISKGEAYFQVHDYFRQGAIFFAPEVALRAREARDRSTREVG